MAKGNAPFRSAWLWKRDNTPLADVNFLSKHLNFTKKSQDILNFSNNFFWVDSSPGEMILRPNGAGNQQQWDAEGGDYTRISEIESDGDTTRLYTPTDDRVATFTLSDPTTTYGAIKGVKVYLMIKGIDPISNSTQCAIRVSGTDYFSPTITYNNTSYHIESYEWETNPATGVRWTWSDLTSLEAGMKRITGGGQTVTQVYVGINFYMASAIEQEGFAWKPDTHNELFPQTSVVDDFNRANAASLGAAWTDGYNGNAISSNQAAGEVGGDWNITTLNATPSSADVEAYITLATVTTDDKAGLFVRWDGVAGDGYGLTAHYNSSGYYLNLYKTVAWTDTNLAQYYTSFSNGDQIGMSAIGNTLRVFYKPTGGSWKKVIEYTDTSIPDAGQFELVTFGTSARVDDFGCGEITSPNSNGVLLLAAQDTDITLDPGDTARLRTIINTTGDLEESAFKLQYKLSTDTEYLDVAVDDYNELYNETMSSTPSTGTLQGSATYDSGSNSLQLNPATNSTHGEWYFSSGLTTNFTIETDIYAGGGTGADAIWFFFGTTYVPEAEDWDADGYHIAFSEYSDDIKIWWNQTVISTTSYSSLDNSTWRTAKIVKLGDNFKIYINDSLVVNFTDSTRTLAGSYWGLGGRSGGLNNIHRVRNVVVYEGTRPGDITLSPSTYIAASGENTTLQLAAPSGKNSWDFNSGRIQDDENPTDNISLGINAYTELEWALKVDSGVTGGNIYDFRVVIGDYPLTAYTVTPQINITSTGTSSSDSRDIRITGRATNSDSRDLRVGGKAVSSDSRDIRITGAAASEVTLDLQVGASGDDSHMEDIADNSGTSPTDGTTTSLTNTLLSPGSHSAGNCYSVAARFTVNAPQGATISSSTFSLYCDADYSTANTIKLYFSAQDADDAAALASTSGNLNSSVRPRTTANTVYTVSTLTAGWKTYDVTDAVQEVVSRAGWTNNNHIVVLVDNHEDTVDAEWQDYRSYDYGSTYAPKLQVVYLTGGTSSSDSRDLRITGRSTNSDSRDIRVSGKSSSSDSRDIRLSGKASSSDSRDLRITGVATTSTDTRDIRVTGKSTSSDSRDVRVTGKNTSNDSRDVRITGKQGANEARDIRVTGKSSSNDTRDIRVSGKDASSATRDIRVTGKNSGSDQRDIRITGKAASNDSRDIRITGFGGVDVTRDIRITGKATSSDSRDIHVTGQSTSSDSRDVRLTGKAQSSSDRDVRLVGKDTSETSRDVRITGLSTNADQRDVRVTGKALDSDSRDIRVTGNGVTSDSRDIRISGTSTSEATRDIRVTGAATSSSARDVRITGVPAGFTSAERGIRITGGMVIDFDPTVIFVDGEPARQIRGKFYEPID